MPTENPPFRAPSHDDISRHARHVWLSRGSPAGQDEAMWLEAERQLLAGFRKAQAMPAPMTSKEQRLVGNSPIDQAELQARLDSVGRTAQNSPTSLDLT